MVEGYCLFEGAVFLDDKGPQKQEMKGNTKEYARPIVYERYRIVRSTQMLVHGPIYDSCDVTTFSCTPQKKTYFDWLNLKKSTSSVETR